MGVAKGRSIQGARWRTRQAAKTINRQDILPNIQEGWMAKSKAGQAMFGGEKESENGKSQQSLNWNIYTYIFSCNNI